MRDHLPIPIESFRGLWARGSVLDGCPLDHFTDCNNVDFDEQNVVARDAFQSAFILGLAGSGSLPVRWRIYNISVGGVDTSFILMLTSTEKFYALKFQPSVAAPTLLINFGGATGINNFDLAIYGNRAYITFSNSYVGVGYVYRYDGTTFALAAGIGPVDAGNFTVANSATAGNVQAGVHYFSYAFEYDTGFISTFKFVTGTVGTPAGVVAPGNKKIDLSNINLGGTNVVARRIFATKVIPNGDLTTDFTGANNEFFFVARIPDNTTTTITIDFFDNALIEPANYLQDVAEFINAGVAITNYHNRLVVGGLSDPAGGTDIEDTSSISIIASYPNDPDTFDIVESLINVNQFSNSNIVDTTGAPIEVGVLALQEYRDVLYTWAANKTVSIVDNGDVPSTWVPNIVDDGIGAFVNGVIIVMDAGSVNINYLIVADKTGLYIFNGNYIKPELSWKITSLWKRITKIPNPAIGIKLLRCFVNDTFNKKIYILLSYDESVLPNEFLLCDYGLVDVNDLANYKQIRFSRWRFNTSAFALTAMVIYDTGTGSKLYAAGSVINLDYVYLLDGPVGLVTEPIISPYIQTALIHDDERNVIHFGALRLRINGNGVATQALTFTIINEDSLRSTVLNPYVLPIALLGKEPTILCNFLAQQAMIKMAVPDNGYFNLNRLAVYIKPVYTELPL